MDKNPTKKCPDCLAEVPIQAKKCSHCGSKLPQPTSPIVKVFVAILGLGFFMSIVMAGSMGSPSTPQLPSQASYELSARAYSEMYVERILKSPSTAEFCRGTSTSLGENKWQVTSCVDSQNGFGAMIRSNWEAVMVYTGGNPDDVGSWQAEKIIFDGEVVYPAQ